MYVSLSRSFSCSNCPEIFSFIFKFSQFFLIIFPNFFQLCALIFLQILFVFFLDLFAVVLLFSSVTLSCCSKIISQHPFKASQCFPLLSFQILHSKCPGFKLAKLEFFVLNTRQWRKEILWIHTGKILFCCHPLQELWKRVIALCVSWQTNHGHF